MAKSQPKKITPEGDGCRVQRFPFPPRKQKDAIFIEGHADCLSWKEFQGLERPMMRGLLKAVEKWLGAPFNASRSRVYHGWKSSDYNGRYPLCFVFKHQGVDRRQVRLYGFLAHPDPGNRRKQVFVAVHHVVKKKDKTNESDLMRVNRALTDMDVQLALQAWGLRLRMEGME